MTTSNLKSLLVLAALFMLQHLTLPTNVKAQSPIRLSFIVDAHPEPYLSNWADKRSTMIVTVMNTGSGVAEIILDAQLSLNGKMVASTQREKMRRILAPPGASQYYAEDVFPQNAISFQGDADQTAIRTGKLPAGAYTICVRALDSKSFAELTPPVCKNMNITDYQAPVAIFPEDKSSLEVKKRITFRWTPVSPKRPGVNYKVQMFEVLQGQTPATAWRANRPLLEKTLANTTQLLYPADYEMPQDGKQYVWGVYALDDRNNPIGDGGGLGGPNAFRVVSKVSQGDGFITINPTVPNDTTAWPWNFTLCNRHNVLWSGIEAELNRLATCGKPLNQKICTSYSELETLPAGSYQYLWNGSGSHSFTVTEQNWLLTQARQWALNNRPNCANGQLKSIIAITFYAHLSNDLSGQDDYHTVYCTVQYGCCTQVINNQHYTPTLNGGNEKSYRLTPTSPNGQLPVDEKRPLFTWEVVDSNGKKASASIPVTVKLVKLLAGQGIEEAAEKNSALFETHVEKGLEFRYTGPLLDTGVSYVWAAITDSESGGVSGHARWFVIGGGTQPLSPPPCLCTSTLPNPVASFCYGATPLQLSIYESVPDVNTCLPFAIGGYQYTADYVDQWGTVTSLVPNPANGLYVPSLTVPFPPNLQPGVYTFNVTGWNNGNFCKRSKIVYIYPTMGAASFATGPICSGDEGELSVSVNPPNAPVDWFYFDGLTGGTTPAFPSPSWIPWAPSGGAPGGALFTNPIDIDPSLCGCPQGGTVTRTYRAILDFASYGLPPPPSTLVCTSTPDVPVTVYCHTDPASIAASINATDPGHTIANNEICSWDNSGPVAANYPIVLDLAWVAGCGNLTSWTTTGSNTTLVGGSTNSNQTWTINTPSTLGTNTYAVTVNIDNGNSLFPATSPCGPKSVTLSITVVDPPLPPVFTVIEIDQKPVSGITCPFPVCPQTDATFAISPVVPGLIYQWSYMPVLVCPPGSDPCPDPNAAWIPVSGSGAGTGPNQNTNEIGPLNSMWKHVWWRVTAQDPEGICDPVSSICCLVDVIQPPCAPVIAKGPYQICSGSDGIKLRAALGTSSDPNVCCGPITGYQWYWFGDGGPVGPYSTSSVPPLCNATRPGAYVLVADGPCASTASEPVEVKEVKVGVTIEGCKCCPAKDEPVKLTATGATDCTGGGGTYSWTGPNGFTASTASITVTPPPGVASTYCVTYTDNCGCVATDCCIISVCK
jgi:hypothetical protein